MKFLLVYPDRYFGVKNRRKMLVYVPPTGLLTLAGMLPKDADVEFVDERINPIDWDTGADIVCITGFTADAVRMYEIADRFHSLGKKVILGGIHTTTMPEEALMHSDSIVVGEAEGVIKEMLYDIEKNQLKKIYSSPFPELSVSPPQRIDLLNNQNRYINILQTTRGCPYNCNFCTVPVVFGRKIRTKPIENVMKEISTFTKKLLFIVDDNILAVPSYARKLFLKFKELGINWVGQASVNLIDKFTNLVKLAREGGCRGFLIGFESISSKQLKKLNKKQNNVKKYKEVVNKLHDYGISVVGSFMFGLDEDDESTFPMSLKFVEDTKVDLVTAGILTPFPGTPLFNEMEKEKRIITKDWSKYDAGHVVIKPKNLCPGKLLKGLHQFYKEFYRGFDILKRLSRNIKNWKFLLPINLAYRQVAKTGFANYRPREDRFKKVIKRGIG